MNLSEQAIHLLDIESAQNKKTIKDSFDEMENLVNSSIEGLESTETNKSEDHSHPFSVAGRLSSNNYEARAKDEALARALEKIRNAGPRSKNGIIRGV